MQPNIITIDSLRELAKISGVSDTDLARKGYLQVANEVLQGQCTKLTTCMGSLVAKLRDESEESLPVDVRSLCEQAKQLINESGADAAYLAEEDTDQKSNLLARLGMLMSRRESLFAALDDLNNKVHAMDIESLSFGVRSASERADRTLKWVLHCSIRAQRTRSSLRA